METLKEKIAKTIKSYTIVPGLSDWKCGVVAEEIVKLLIKEKYIQNEEENKWKY